MSYQEQYATVRTPFGEPGPYYDALGHRGTDYPCGAGEPVYAYSNFVVEYVGSSGGLGGVMGLRIPNGYAGWAHIVPALSEGASGGPGTIIGYAAGSGDDHGTAWTGPHIHTTFSPVSAQNAALGVRPLQDPAPIIAEYIGMTGTAASGVTGANDASLRSVQGDGITYWEPTGDLAKEIGVELIRCGALPADYADHNDGDPGKVWREGNQNALIQYGYWTGTPDGLLGLHNLAGVQNLAHDHGEYTGDIDSDPQINSWRGFLAGLRALNPVPAETVAPEPAPVVEPTAPVEVIPEPEPIVTEPAPIEPAEPETPTAPSEPEPTIEEHIVTTEQLDQQAELVSGIQPIDLGAIITKSGTRKMVWAIYGLVGLFIIAFMGGMTAARWIAPDWFIFATGSYTAVGPAFASLAIANIKKK